MYEEIIADPNLLASVHPDSTLDFQGYMIYQLLDSTVTWEELGDTSRIRLIYQCDLADAIDTLVNEEQDALGNCGPVTKVMGSNSGVMSNFTILVNPFTLQPYQQNDHPCFLGVAYAYNPYMINPDCSGLPAPFFYGPRMTRSCLSGVFGTEDAEITELNIYPNPVIHSFAVSGDFETALIQLMSIHGVVILQKEILNGEKISAGGLSEGIYILQIAGKTGVSRRTLVVHH